ncbi:MAG TPA: TonB-dependent receptor [Burkholderiales bacterium]|nr:TonB-dependent receptor [Burkholderiales bacterium]
MKKLLQVGIWPAAAICACAHAQSPETIYELDAVIVTAAPSPDGPTLTQPSLRVAKERIEQTPGGVAIVDAEEANRSRALNMSDTFRYTAGVLAQPRFGAEETRLSIRGSGIQRTFHLRGIKLLQDGVPINQADGAGDFQIIEPLATRYMEVYRGANALQYGGNTLGGAINYVSRTGYDTAEFGARIETGSYDYLRGQVSAGGVIGDWDYYGSVSTFDQDGFRDHAQQDGERINANAGYRISSDVETRFYFAWATSNSELPGNLTKAQLKDDPREANALNHALDQRRDLDTTQISNRTVWRFGDSRIEASVFYYDYVLSHPIGIFIDQDAETFGGSLRFVSDAALGGHRNRFIAGVSPVRGDTRQNTFVNVGGEKGTQTDKRDMTAENIDVYAENSFWLNEKLAAVIGVQRSRANREVEDLLIVGPDASYDREFTATSPKYGLLFEVQPDIQLFANVSKSFEPPSFSEPGTIVVANSAQKAWTYEAGTRGQWKGQHWDVSVYHAEVRDELLGINLGGGITGTLNVPHTLHQGVEAAGGGRAGDFNWQTAALLNRFRFDDDPIYGDNTLPGIPKVLIRAEVLYNAGHGLYFGPTLEWSPRKYPIDMANSFDADSYAIWGFRLGQDIDRHWSWFVDARNLSDKKYASTTGVVIDANGTDQAQFLPGDGRSVFAGLQWNM